MSRRLWIALGVAGVFVTLAVWRLVAKSPSEDVAGNHVETGHAAAEHDEDHPELVRLTPDAMRTNGVEVGSAGPAVIEEAVTLPGEVVLNPERVVHVMARVTGTARQVLASVGDEVRPGQLLAVLDSRTLADAKSAYLVAHERLSLAVTRHERARDLRQKQIMAEKDYLEAKQGLAEAGIELRSAERNLHALGLTEEDVARLATEHDTDITRYEIRAPIAGTILERHLVLGELLQESTEAFKLADLGTVWVQLNVYGKDVAVVRRGQRVDLASTDGRQHETGNVDYVNPLIQEETRTGVARVVLPNTQRIWRPGQFVTARIVVASDSVALAVPEAAVQTHEGRSVVFVETPDGFAVRRVRAGRSDGDRTEILEGLEPGARLVVANSFLLKAELGKETAGHDH
jgi:cobalt-zinc-cadmium efflux system membrane fusion protein